MFCSDSYIGFIESSLNWDAWSVCWKLAKCNDFKERVSTAITIDLSILILVSLLSFWGQSNVIIPEHLISLSILSLQFCASCSHLWGVFSELFVSLCQSTPELDPLYPCTWQTNILSSSSQFALQRGFHAPLLKISIDPFEGKPSTVWKRTGNSRKQKVKTWVCHSTQWTQTARGVWERGEWLRMRISEVLLSTNEEVFYIFFLFWYFEGLDTQCIYVSEIAPNNLIIFLSCTFECFECWIKTPINALITPDVQGNGKNATRNIQISKPLMVMRKSRGVE